jgi:hypothetical protein
MRDPRFESATFPAQPQAADLYAIVYVSTAVRQVSLGDMRGLLEDARHRNAAAGITGVLLYSEGSFMQYLEGPARSLAEVYGLIKTHPLHYGLIDLVREPIAVREFAEWSMAFQVVGAFGPSSPLAQDALLADRLGAAAQRNSTACDLLSKFWARGRHSVASALVSHRNARSAQRLAMDLDTGSTD